MRRILVVATIITYILVGCIGGPASAEIVGIPACPTTTTNVSGTFSSDAALFAAADQSVGPRLGFFVQCLTTSCLFALNWNGAAASLTAAGSLVMNGQYAYFNAASLGFIPQGAVRIIASGSSVISAYSCP